MKPSSKVPAPMWKLTGRSQARAADHSGSGGSVVRDLHEEPFEVVLFDASRYADASEDPNAVRITVEAEEVFDFFSRAENLGRITPPWMHFQIQTPTPIDMRAGARIDYRIRLAGVPLAWRTRIEEWTPGAGFVDVQESGPYRHWEHWHEFRRVGDGVLMTDRVEYGLPFGWLGRAAHALAVRATLASIFDYRYHRVREIFK